MPFLWTADTHINLSLIKPFRLGMVVSAGLSRMFLRQGTAKYSMGREVRGAGRQAVVLVICKATGERTCARRQATVAADDVQLSAL